MSMEDAVFALAQAVQEQTEVLKNFRIVQTCNCGDKEAAPAPAPKEEETKADDDEMAKAKAKAAERKAVRAELDRLGVEYNNKLKTENLKKLLEETKEAEAAPEPAPEPAPEKDEAEQDAENDQHFDLQKQVVFGLKKVKEKYGLAKAKEILAGFGAKNVSTLDEIDYEKVIEDIKEVLTDE